MNINSLSVQNMSHNKVVQVLKDCEINQAASITIKRYTQNTSDKFRLKNKKVDVKNCYECKHFSFENNRSKTLVVDSQIKTSTIPNNVLVVDSDPYIMNYDHSSDNYWTQLSSSSNNMCTPTPTYNDLIDSSSENYMDPPQIQYLLNSTIDHYSNNCPKAIQSVGHNIYKMNASKDEIR